jgi:hypothetical protein
MLTAPCQPSAARYPDTEKTIRVANENNIPFLAIMKIPPIPKKQAKSVSHKKH